ncbi:MAG TPA: HoxN/HupN/NixA family nickel/cobalt transporter [Micromonosporaceae bacterium]|nr:HoxN/HupN/NixA family nickel/cobalt transporter [Micromonosporaceae bacterium]
MTDAVVMSGRWTPAERTRLFSIVAVIAGLHVGGWSLFLFYSHSYAAAGSFAGAGVLAYVLGCRHAFDADHIAAIDDTTRLMLQRGRRPVGVGFFFAMGHSTVVLVLAMVVALAAGTASAGQLDGFRSVGGVISAVVATVFLLLVAGLNAVVLRGLVDLWRRMARGELDHARLDALLLDRGLMNRLLGRRLRGMIRSSWHMYPVGILFGLGLETASEITLLSLSASTASGGGLPVLATLSLPLLFAAGMSAFDTGDSLLMTRAYSWAYRRPARTLYYNIATTAMTVLVAAVVGTVYLAGIAHTMSGWRWLHAYAQLSEHLEALGYVIAGLFVLSWALAAGIWRLRGYDTRYRPGKPS